MEHLAQVVIGSPGAGKSTYCTALSQLMTELKRPHLIVNLDPANEAYEYECQVDVRDLITLENAMDAHDLGPNGGLKYCMEFILENSSWLVEEIEANKQPMVILDAPGQVELYAQETAMKALLKTLEKACHFRMVTINLIDSNLCSEPTSFIAATLLSTSMMTCMEFPHINVLSKIDLLSNFWDSLQFGLEYYTKAQELRRLLPEGDSKHARLTRKLSEVIDDYGLVGFIPMSVKDKETMFNVLKQVDRALGCGFMYSESIEESSVTEYIGSIEERYSAGICARLTSSC